MKKILIIVCFLLSHTIVNAQETYTINGETITLKTEVDGTIDLLWNIIDGKYRYFIRTSDNTITELVNTKGDTKNYLEQYKTVLENATEGSGLSTKKLNLTLISLKNFINDYNKSVDASYDAGEKGSDVIARLGVFGGVSNSPFVSNPDNEKTAQFGAEIEVLGYNGRSRHAMFLQFKHVTENDFSNYSTTEISLGYRFRFINSEAFSLYGNTKFATVNFSKSNVSFLDESDTIITKESSETAFDVPFIFGVGADIRITPTSYITLGFNELFALLIDNQGNFPMDITLGYKFNL